MNGAAERVEALTARVRADLAALWGQVVAEVAAVEAAWPSLTTTARARALRGMERAVTALMGRAESAATAGVAPAVTGAWELGGTAAALSVSRAASWTAADVDAVAVLAQDTLADVLAATGHVTESTKTLVRIMAREHLDVKYRDGRTATQAARALAQSLTDHAVTAITYRDGSRHGLADYTDMLIRTKSAEAYQAAGLRQCGHLGIRFVEIFDGPACGWSSHDDTRTANGLILTVEEASQYLLSHPRCRRVSSPRPDLDTADGATPTGPQHSAAEVAQAVAFARARGRGLDDRVARRPDGTLAPGTGQVSSAAQARHLARVGRRT